MGRISVEAKFSMFYTFDVTRPLLRVYKHVNCEITTGKYLQWIKNRGMIAGE